MAFPNIYTHRKVAETSAKSCDICFKLSSSVLITADNKDWFYVCPAHLKDTGFCTPKIDQAAIEARKKRELEEEIERVKREYKEKKQRKKGEKAGSSGEKDEADAKTGKEGKPSEDGKKTEDKTVADGRNNGDADASPPVEEEEPRIFELKSSFYQQRLNRKRQAEIAKRNRERMQDPGFFPSAPRNLP